MKRILNKRLEAVSAFIHDNEKIIDIGCDHGLLGIYLYLNRENIEIISSDINSFPLKQADENLKKYSLEGKIILRQGDGLEAMDNDVTTVVIAGMGGLSMVQILQHINSFPNVSKIILSPNNDFTLVRKSLGKLGFTIKEEIMLWEKKKFYPVMEFIKGQEKIDPFFGKLDLSNKEVLAYYEKKFDTNQTILKKLSPFKRIKRFDLIKENKMIQRKLHTMQKHSKNIVNK